MFRLSRWFTVFSTTRLQLRSCHPLFHLIVQLSPNILFNHWSRMIRRNILFLTSQPVCWTPLLLLGWITFSLSWEVCSCRYHSPVQFCANFNSLILDHSHFFFTSFLKSMKPFNLLLIDLSFLKFYYIFFYFYLSLFIYFFLFIFFLFFFY